MFEQYNDKKVLITGNTGFKGSWLTVWLLKLGAKVVGVSNGIPTNPSMFEALELTQKVTQYFEDVRNLTALQKIIRDEKPDFIFHLAAQAIVSRSFTDPIETIGTNTIGTANLLESLRSLNPDCIVVMITSDKAYDNVEQIWGYREDDRVGGKDVYSGSKGCAELVIKSYWHSFFNKDFCKVKLGIGRAGNVIGGGDWAEDRIVVDCINAWSRKAKVEIRSPDATRPWQHVLEPLSGYLRLGVELTKNDALSGEGFNFGPRAEQNRTVKELITSLSLYWFEKESEAFTITDNIAFHEASLLKLNCDKALAYLNWQATLNYEQTVVFTGEWYREYFDNVSSIHAKTIEQIDAYEERYYSAAGNRLP